MNKIMNNIGSVAYGAYVESIRKTNKSVNEDYLYWGDLYDEERDAWNKAALAVIEHATTMI